KLSSVGIPHFSQTLSSSLCKRYGAVWPCCVCPLDMVSHLPLCSIILLQIYASQSSSMQYHRNRFDRFAFNICSCSGVGGGFLIILSASKAIFLLSPMVQGIK